MGKLTDEQVEQAAKAMFTAWYSKTPLNMDWGDANKPMWIAAAHAAAPFLQLPWDEPTREEFSSIHDSSICLYGDGKLCRAVSDALRQFILIRNAAMISKPVDPRIQAVEGVLEMLTDEGGRIFSPQKLQEISERILYWIDEV